MAEPQPSGDAPRRRAPGRIAALAGGALVVVVALTLLAVHVFGSSPAPAPVAAEPTTTVPAPTTTLPPPPVPRITTIAEISGPIPFYAEPNGPEAGTVPVGKWWGTVKHVPVIARQPGWLQVRLPQRPNGLTGWIPESSAVLSSTTYGILIDTTARRVRLYNAGNIVADFPAGVGTQNDPTPLGQYYLMVVQAPPSSGYAPFVMGTNAHSESIESWEGSGDAFTALHGPLGMDAAIGTTGAAISHGCVRMHSTDLAQLSPVPVGAPVVIV